MGAGHDHGSTSIRYEKPLWWALGLTSAFLVVEVVGAYLTNSLALLSDAAHMGTDALALVIALVAVRLGRRPADAQRTFGYIRMEAMGAMANGLLLFAVAMYILWEAVARLRQPPDVSADGMLAVASIGLVVNLVAMRLLKAGSGDNLNVKGAYLEAWADMLGSIGVIAGALIIRLTGWSIVDPVVAALIGLWILPRTWTLLREAGNVLMLGVPKGVHLEEVRSALLGCSGVTGVHDLHVWALGSTQRALTAHIVIDVGVDGNAVRQRLDALLDAQFEIEHTTLQIESTECGGHSCDVSQH